MAEAELRTWQPVHCRGCALPVAFTDGQLFATIRPLRFMSVVTVGCSSCGMMRKFVPDDVSAEHPTMGRK